MGTAITLSLNGIDIDYGQDRSWRRHHWLFPPDSITEIDYLYADDVTETKSGFETALEKTRFRLCHLGYSLQETRTRFRVRRDPLEQDCRFAIVLRGLSRTAHEP